jgi:hypothetical protein
VIAAHRPLVLIELRRARGREEVVGGERRTNRRVKLLAEFANPARNLADTGRRDDVPGEWIGDKLAIDLAQRLRIVNRAAIDGPPQRVGADLFGRQQTAQVAVVHFQLRHGAIRRAKDKLALAIAFEREEEEGFFTSVIKLRNPNRPAEAAAVIEAALLRSGQFARIVDERIGVERFVA